MVNGWVKNKRKMERRSELNKKNIEMLEISQNENGNSLETELNDQKDAKKKKKPQ